MSSTNRLSQLLAAADAFGQPIQVNFKGRESFGTVSGGLISLLKNVFITWLTLITLMQLIN